MKRLSFLCALLLLGSVSAWGELAVTSGQLQDATVIDPNYGTKLFLYDYWASTTGAEVTATNDLWNTSFRADSARCQAGGEDTAGMVSISGTNQNNFISLMKFNFEGTGYAVGKLWLTAMHASWHIPTGVSILITQEYSVNKGATWQQFPHSGQEAPLLGYPRRTIVDSTPEVVEWDSIDLNTNSYPAVTNYLPYTLPKGGTTFWYRYTVRTSDGSNFFNTANCHLFRWNSDGRPTQGLHMKFGLDPIMVNLAETDATTSVMEQGPTSDNYTLALTQAPTAPVTINFTPADPNALLPASCTVAPLSLTFTAADWNVPQTVSVTAIDNTRRQGVWYTNLVGAAMTSTDVAFDGKFVPEVGVNIRDNDTPEIVTVTTAPFEVREQGVTATTFTVNFNVAPTSGDAVVTLTGDAAQFAISPATLTFNASNFSVPQTVTLTAADDATMETYEQPLPVTLTTACAGDSWFNNLPAVNAVLTLNVYDNECGAWGHSTYDSNNDCYLDLLDFANFTTGWMICSRPEDPLCTKLN